MRLSLNVPSITGENDIDIEHELRLEREALVQSSAVTTKGGDKAEIELIIR